MPSLLGTPNRALEPALGALAELLAPSCDSARAQCLISGTPGLIEAAQRHRVAPLVYDRWASELEAALGAEGAEHWRQVFLWMMTLCHSRRRAAAEFLEALADAGIPVVVMRGLWLAEAVYPDPVLRPHEDIDILVPLERAPEVGPVLEACGLEPREESRLMAAWRAGRDLPPGDYDVWGGWMRQFSERLAIKVDVHVGLSLIHAFWWPHRPAASVAMAHSEPWEFLGARARCLNPHYALLAQCENISRHSVGGVAGEDNMVRYYDLRLLIPQLTAQDWDEFVADVTALHLGLPTRLILQRVAELWDVPLPADLAQRIPVSATALALARTALRRPRWLGHLGQKALFQLAGTDSLPLAAAYIRHNLLPGLKLATTRASSHRTSEAS